MKNQISFLTVLGVLSIIGTNARADDANAALGVSNLSRKDVVITGDTYCMDGPGTTIVKPQESFSIYWDQKKWGSCFFLGHRVIVILDQPDLTETMYFSAETTGPWKFAKPVTVKQRPENLVIKMSNDGKDLLLTPVYGRQSGEILLVNETSIEAAFNIANSKVNFWTDVPANSQKSVAVLLLY